MDFATLVKFLVPALKATLPAIDPSTPAGKIAKVVLTLLPMFSFQTAHLAPTWRATQSFGETPPVELPPEEHWTPEGLLEYAQTLPPTAGAAPGTTPP